VRRPESWELHAGVYGRTRRLIARLAAEGTRAVSLQLTFDPEAFGVAEAARFCDDALGRSLAREAP
jgi:hypothetical protein